MTDLIRYRIPCQKNLPYKIDLPQDFEPTQIWLHNSGSYDQEKEL